jgi:hypothetical protein
MINNTKFEINNLKENMVDTINNLKVDLNVQRAEDMKTYSNMNSAEINLLFQRMSDKFDTSVEVLSEKIDAGNNIHTNKSGKSNSLSTPRSGVLRSSSRIKQRESGNNSFMDDTENNMETENIDNSMINHNNQN